MNITSILSPYGILRRFLGEPAYESEDKGTGDLSVAGSSPFADGLLAQLKDETAFAELVQGPVGHL